MGFKHLPGSREVRFRLPEAQLEQLKARALEARRSRAEYLRELVVAHLDPAAAVDAAMAEAGAEADANAKTLRELHRRLDTDPGSIKDSLFGKLAERALDKLDAEGPVDDLGQLLAAIGEDPSSGRKVDEIADILRGSSLPDDRRLELAEDGLVAYRRSRKRTNAAEADLRVFAEELRAVPA